MADSIAKMMRNGNTWNLMYPALIKNIVDILDKTKDNEREVNIHSVARIYKVYLFSILTDMYGDCPYFEAGKKLYHR